MLEKVVKHPQRPEPVKGDTTIIWLGTAANFANYKQFTSGGVHVLDNGFLAGKCDRKSSPLGL